MKTIAVLGGAIALFVAFLIFGALWPIGEAAQRLSTAADSLGGAEYLLEPAIDQAIDRMNESGYNPRPIDPDDPLLKQRVVLVCEGMSERVARYTVERLVYLDGLDPTAPIELRIATSGGWVDSAFAIVDTMRAIRAPVDVTAIGGCYSAGTLVLAAGTGTRSATPNALMSIHVNDYYRGDDPFDADRHELQRFRAVYRRHTRVPMDWFEQPGDNQYYLDAPQALEMGLIDEISETRWESPEEEEEPLAPAA